MLSAECTSLVIKHGLHTELANCRTLKFRPPETEFEHGVKAFGYFLMIDYPGSGNGNLAINIYFQRQYWLRAFFTGLAVGLTPTILPVIISINLSHGPNEWQSKKSSSNAWPSIENFGSMNYCVLIRPVLWLKDYGVCTHSQGTDVWKW